MRTIAFDGHSGASGDMILASLLAAGADPDVLADVEDALEVSYRIGDTTKRGIHAKTVDVLVDDGPDGDRDNDHTHDEKHHHADHTHDHAEGAGPNRTYAECREIVAGMGLPEGVESSAKAVFGILGEAEARVHGTDLESTQFHEVGADDAIADIVGAALLFADLGADRIVTTPVFAGGGEVSMSHGVYPVPTPAVTYIAETADWELRGGPVETELLTPTGAAILAEFAEGVDSFPPMSVEGSGYGAGSKSLEGRPNVLRATVGDTKGGLVRDEIRILETNLDDATPEMLGGLQSTLKAAGARDVVVLPATMKKSRPGHLVKVVVKPQDTEAVARRLAEETGTLGVRELPVGHRWIAERSFETVEFDVDGETVGVTVKVATDDDGEIYDVSAEYDDAATVAAATDRPIREIAHRAESVYYDRRGR